MNNSSVKRVVDLKVLTKLAQSDLAQQDEYLLLDVFPKRVLDELLRHLPDLIFRMAGRDVGSRLTEEQITAVSLRLVLDEKLGRQTPEVVQHIAALAGIGTVEKKSTNSPASPSEPVTYEAACYRLGAQFGRTGQQANPGETITPGREAVAATRLGHPGAPVHLSLARSLPRSPQPLIRK